MPDQCEHSGFCNPVVAQAFLTLAEEVRVQAFMSPKSGDTVERLTQLRKMANDALEGFTLHDHDQGPSQRFIRATCLTGNLIKTSWINTDDIHIVHELTERDEIPSTAKSLIVYGDNNHLYVQETAESLVKQINE